MSPAAHLLLWLGLGAVLVVGTVDRVRAARAGRRGRAWDLFLGTAWTVWWVELGVTVMLRAPAPEPAPPRAWPERDLGLPIRMPLPTWTLPTAERPLTRQPGTWRVAVLGDSFVAGIGVAAGDTLPEQLAVALDGRTAPLAPEVLNLGVPSFGTHDLLARLEDAAVPLAPDVIVWVHVLNDLPSPALVDLDNLGPAIDDAIVDRSAPGSGGAWWTLRAVRDLAERRAVGAAVERAYRDGHDPRLAGRTLDELAERLTPLVAAQRARGGRFVLAVYPLLHRLDAYPFVDAHRTMLHLAERVGAEPVDLLPAFRGRDARTLWATPRDHHPNASAHALAASTLAQALLAGPIAVAGPPACPPPPAAAETAEDRRAAARTARCLDPSDPRPALALAEAWLDLPAPAVAPKQLRRAHAGLAVEFAAALAALRPGVLDPAALHAVAARVDAPPEAP